MAAECDSEIIQLWLASQPSPHTRSCYQRDVQRLSAFARKPIGELQLADLQQFVHSLGGLAPISRGRTIAAIRSLFRFCQPRRFVSDNPASELALPRYERRLVERMLGEAEVRQLVQRKPNNRDSLLLRLLYVAGLRVSEAIQLRWRNLVARGTRGQITMFGKNGKTRAILLPADLWQDLITLRADAAGEDPVFPSRSGRTLDRGRVRRILRDFVQTAGIDAAVSPHWLRHAHASHALDHGAPIHLVQATLGHSSVATTSMYLHARPGDSSARFLPIQSGINLQDAETGAMNGVTAIEIAQGETDMKSKKNSAAAPAEAGPKTDTNTKTKASVRKPARPVAPAKSKATKETTVAKEGSTPRPAEKRANSKGAQILELLNRPGGATLAELMSATSWQAHSVRGFLSGTLRKKMKLDVKLTKNEAGERLYSIAI
jgi:integrase/recombinase XerD